MSNANRRRAARFTAAGGLVRARHRGLLRSRHLLEGKVVDFSMTGCSFLSRERIPRASRIRAEVRLPDGGIPLVVTGRVAHESLVVVDGCTRNRVGVEFDGLDRSDALLVWHRLRSGLIGEQVSRARGAWA